jgi:hypothetical protein
LLLYKQEDIIAIEEKLDINGDRATTHQSKTDKTLADSYELF